MFTRFFIGSVTLSCVSFALIFAFDIELTINSIPIILGSSFVAGVIIGLVMVYLDALKEDTHVKIFTEEDWYDMTGGLTGKKEG